jgi:hypothetical protein
MIPTDFGIVIACSDQSYLFVKGCCASIRYFLGDVPICVLIDGDFSGADLARTYGATIINRCTPIEPALRERSFGWGLTKMIAFWEAPWSRFLSLDPDTIVWGDVLSFFEDADLVLDQQYARTESGEIVNPLLFDFLGQPPPDAGLRRAVIDYCIFDTQQVQAYFPDFDWKRFLYQYAWTGVYFARRGIFDLDEYVELLAFADRHPGVFLGGEMGILNFLAFRAAGQGRLRVTNTPMQVLVPQETPEDLERRFPWRGRPDLAPSEAAVIHWTGSGKPTLVSGRFAGPMRFARRQHQVYAHGSTGFATDLALCWEDLQRLFYRERYNLNRRVRRRLPTLRRADPLRRDGRGPSA